MRNGLNTDDQGGALARAHMSQLTPRMVEAAIRHETSRLLRKLDAAILDDDTREKFRAIVEDGSKRWREFFRASPDALTDVEGVRITIRDWARDMRSLWAHGVWGYQDKKKREDPEPKPQQKTDETSRTNSAKGK